MGSFEENEEIIESALGLALILGPAFSALVSFAATCAILWYYGQLSQPTAVAAGAAAVLAVAPWYVIVVKIVWE